MISARTQETRRFPSRWPSGKQGCVLALEPNRYVFPVLQKNAELNPGKTNIVPLMFAATPEDAEMEFQYSDSGYLQWRPIRGDEQMAARACLPAEGAREKSAIVFENEYPELLPRIRYIKIDTEGYEATVLASLSELIARNKPFLKLEVYRKLDEAQRHALYRSIAAFGYVVRKIAEDGNYFGEILNEQDMNKWRHFDVFCAPVRLRQFVWCSLDAPVYCTKPTLGTGVGSGTSRMGPNCAS